MQAQRAPSGMGVDWSYVICLRGAELMTARCCSPLIGHHLRPKKKKMIPHVLHSWPRVCLLPGSPLSAGSLLTPTLSSSAPSNVIYLFLLCVSV